MWRSTGIRSPMREHKQQKKKTLVWQRMPKSPRHQKEAHNTKDERFNDLRAVTRRMIRRKNIEAYNKTTENVGKKAGSTIETQERLHTYSPKSAKRTRTHARKDSITAECIT